MDKKYTLLLVGLLCLTLASGWFLWRLLQLEKGTTVTFLNVGQGDAILIAQGRNQVLIDGGRTGKELLARLGRNIPFWDRTIEVVIATHPDADHIGGFPGLLRSYRVEQVLTTGAESETEIFWLFQWSIKQYVQHEALKIFRGTKITFPAGGELLVEYPLNPLPKETADANSGSIVSRFTYGETSFLLTGDLPHEETVLPDETVATVLKVAHHGSRYSTSEAFLERIRPKEAVISVGENNYGHPAPEVLERLERFGTAVYQTDQRGDIQYRCTPALNGCQQVP